MQPARARGRILAGLVDAGLASMASFAVALYAVRFLEPSLLGAYALFFTAFGFAGFVSATLYLLPTRIAAMEAPERARLSILPPTLRIGALIGGLAAVLTPLVGVFALKEVSVADMAPLALPAALLVMLSPLQDHLRATFHLAGLSWRATTMSVAQLITCLVAILGLHLSPVAPQWVPFGALVIANCTSLSLGLWLARDRIGQKGTDLPPIGDLVRSGRALLVGNLIPVFAQLAAAGLVATLGSVQDVGYAEAARVVASPILVASLGISQALSPAMMDAGRTGARPVASHARKLFLIAFLPLSALYVGVVGWSWLFNPMRELLPVAYHLDGLVLLSLAAILAYGFFYFPRYELVGAQQGGRLVKPVFVGAVLHLALVVTLVSFIGGYVLPLGMLASNALAGVWSYRRAEELFA